jgi:hypothetical protein
MLQISNIHVVILHNFASQNQCFLSFFADRNIVLIPSIHASHVYYIHTSVSTRGWLQVVDEPPLFFVNTIIVVRRLCYDIVTTSSRIYTPVPCSSMCWSSGCAFIVMQILILVHANTISSRCKLNSLFRKIYCFIWSKHFFLPSNIDGKEYLLLYWKKTHVFVSLEQAIIWSFEGYSFKFGKN